MPLLKNTVVWASAGTGKTRKLVETYVDLLADGLDPMRIVAMTFTEKAAGELRDRVRSAIYTRTDQMDQSERGRWMRVVGLLPAAPISTIHGFCGLLLRDNGLHIGIDPGFVILDEQRSLDLARESAVETIRQEIRAGNDEAERLFGDFGLDALVETIISGAYWTNSLGKTAAWLEERADAQAAAAEVVEAEISEHLSMHGRDFDKIGQFADDLEARKARHPLRKRDDPAAVLPRIGQIAGVQVSRELSRLIALAVERNRAKKRAANAMDFDDLLLGARDLLRDQPAIRRHYQMHFQAILVDEFQDTDEVQAEIIRLLAADPEQDSDTASRLAPGKLLIVGDPKQSIYRFRRARVTVFLRMLNEICESGGILEHLQGNYRSAAPLVEFSNRLSERMLDGIGKHNPLPAEIDPTYRIRFSEGDILQPKSARSFLGITYIAADPESRAAAGREMEAEAIARLLKTWRASGTIESWREVAVLMRAMTNASIYTEALERHGIPFYIMEGTTFYQKTEISDLIAMLELVLRPDDPVARTTVLTSSLVGLSFQNLADSETSSAMDALLAPWIELRDRATAAEILEDVVRRTGFDVVMMAQKNGEQRVANIGKLIEITRNLARQGTAALDDVVRHLRSRALDTSVREPEAQVVGQDEDVVRVLTVHKAKGLEFDVVIIPDLAAKARSASTDRSFFSDRWGLLAGAAYGLHRKPLPHALILRGKQEEDDQQFEEEKRLLYVAVTRARKMLVLGEGFSKHAGLWLGWVEALFESVQPGVIEKAREGKAGKIRFRGRGQDFVVDVLPAVAFTRPEQLALNIDIASVNRDAAYRELAAMKESFRETKAPRAVPVEMTPSDLTALQGCFRYFDWTRLQGVPEPGRIASGDNASMRAGSAAHKILETGIMPALTVLKAAGLGDLPAVFASREWRALDKLPVERELPFIMHIRAAGQDCFVRGRMDAVIHGDPPRVMDYKFAVWRKESEAGYKIQMMVYSLALMKSLGADRAVAELWYLKTPMKVLRFEYTRAEAEARVTDLIERYLVALHTGEWPLADRTYCDATQCGFRAQCWGV